MQNVTQSLLGLFDSIQSRIDDRNSRPAAVLCEVADKMVTWSKNVDLSELDSTPTNIFSQLMTLVSNGVSGASADADRSLGSIRAALPILRNGLRRHIAKAA
ncbi:hypothetical protein [Pseudomonas putida]|uniref:Uncharacterized protein n=1 Tax=Pseudomonas putida TaxID=303 RepID=A0A8I1EBV4_PSEPU|nr:hypothetical protein [Pseudomonas putida]MBI6883182.1 hypothetical protein [Pseudomonas putida]